MPASTNTTKPSPIIDATPPRSFDSPAIKEDAKGTLVAVGIWGGLAVLTFTLGLDSYRDRSWTGFGIAAVATIILVLLVTRYLVSAFRVRRVWKYGTLTETKVRRSEVAWKDYQGGAWTIEVEVEDGATLTFDWPSGEPVGGVFPALVHNGWLLILFDGNNVALKRMPR